MKGVIFQLALPTLKIKFYITDGKLYIAEDIGAGLDVGTYKFTFSW